jgi:hypothetical protein
MDGYRGDGGGKYVNRLVSYLRNGDAYKYRDY